MVHAQSPASGTTRLPADEEAAALLGELAIGIRAYGLVAHVYEADRSLTAVNPAELMLTQTVVLALGEDGAPYWHWRWSPHDEPASSNRICCGRAIAEAAEKLVRVISLHQPAPGGRSSSRGAPH